MATQAKLTNDEARLAAAIAEDLRRALVASLETLRTSSGPVPAHIAVAGVSALSFAVSAIHRAATSAERPKGAMLN